MKALFVLPLATAEAPAWLHLALETRLFATITRSCPCGATYDAAELRPDKVHTPAMRHEAHSAASSQPPDSAAVLPDWIELRMIAVELEGEAAA